MTKNTLYILVLDASGSMNSVRQETIDGYNAYIQEEQKEPEGKHFLLVVFNSLKINVSGVQKMADVKPLTAEDYTPMGFTPLYDAVGKAVETAEACITAAKGFGSKKKQRVLLITMTDGEENSSIEFSRKSVMKLFKDKESLGWGIVYLGANQDAFAEGAKMGVSADSSGNIQMHNMSAAYAGMSNISANYRTRGNSKLIDDITRKRMSGK